MKTHTVKVPGSLNLEGSLELARELRELPEADRYILNFRELHWVEPFGMLFAADHVRKLSRKRREARFLARSFRNNTYAAHMGFFQALGVDFGKLPGEAQGNSHYLPITILKVKALRQEANQRCQAIGDAIERRSKQLARMLTQCTDSDLVDTLTYAFREIIRNVVEHSESATLQYCAQYWPTKHLVEIAILDAGIGIRASLSKNPYFTAETDHDALNLSLVPGVSGKAYEGKTGNPYDVWENSGFGLYLTSRLCGNGGSFFICSGDAGILLNKNGKHYLNTTFLGTAIRLKLRTNRAQTLKQSLRRFLKEGDEIAKAFLDGSPVTASRASRMLWDDFRR